MHGRIKLDDCANLCEMSCDVTGRIHQLTTNAKPSSPPSPLLLPRHPPPLQIPSTVCVLLLVPFPLRAILAAWGASIIPSRETVCSVQSASSLALAECRREDWCLRSLRPILLFLRKGSPILLSRPRGLIPLHLRDRSRWAGHHPRAGPPPAHRQREPHHEARDPRERQDGKGRQGVHAGAFWGRMPNLCECGVGV